MSESDVAIIIPCYNGWKYMSRCLESLEKQTVAPKQVIIVDDCSTDDSYISLSAYSKESVLPILVIKNDTNSGPGKSRENAIKHVNTGYVAFCDCDDWYEEDFLQCVSDALQKEKSTDLVIFDNYICSEDGEKRIAHTTTGLQQKSKQELLAQYPMSLCRLVCKTEIIRHIPFPALYHAEDGVVATQIIANSERIIILDRPLYNYLTRVGSASTKPTPDACRDFYTAYELIFRELEEWYPDEVEFIGIKFVCYGSVLNGFKSGVSAKEICILLNCFEKTNPKWYGNRYMTSLPQTKRIYLYTVKNRLWALTKILTYIHTRMVG